MAIRRKRFGRLRLVLAALLCPGAAAHAAPAAFGWVEWVRVEPGGQRLKAKLDTGARTSSLSALEIEVQEVADGPDRVAFRLEDADGGPGPRVERPVVRWVRIKRHDARPDRRPVVEMDVCLGALRRTVEVSLADRSKFNYPVLLGRNFLAGAAVVDAGATFTGDPCPPEPEPPPDAEDEEEPDEEEVGEPEAEDPEGGTH